VAWARRWTLSELGTVYAGLGTTASDIETVVSELITNALQAGCQRLSLGLNAHHRYVRVAAGDEAPGEPVVHHPTAEESHGRGLLIVAALSTRWGVDHHNNHKTVWAEIPLTGHAGATFDAPTGSRLARHPATLAAIRRGTLLVHPLPRSADSALVDHASDQRSDGPLLRRRSRPVRRATWRRRRSRGRRRGCASRCR
jgi:anti-sigma regulatory factor (Ser/Thr protein kinase)